MAFIEYSSAKYDDVNARKKAFATLCFCYEVSVNVWPYSLFTAVRFWNEKCDHDGFKFATSFFAETVVYCTIEREVRSRCLTTFTHKARFSPQCGSC